VFYYKSGKKKWEVTYNAGRKAGQETFWDPKGLKIWERSHKANGISIWTQYWPNGKKKAESSWRGYKAEGPAMRWDSNGNVTSDLNFYNGRVNLRR
jgi:antitoxin component YwqK of YwqJK toxin-antitoxin module